MCAKQNLRDKIITISRTLRIRTANTVYAVQCLPVMAQSFFTVQKKKFSIAMQVKSFGHIHCKATKINFILGKKKKRYYHISWQPENNIS